MIFKGALFSETPIYRGNARKILFTRDGDGKQKMVSLAGEISGTAQALMDAFIGESKNKKNIGLLNQMWQRIYNEPMPRNLVSKVDCKLRKECYPPNQLFDLRMGIKLDEDRWASEANANYKIETLYKNSVFDFSMNVNDSTLGENNNSDKLHYLLQELVAGRFWFGAGKSKGLGRVRLELNSSLPAPENTPKINKKSNHLQIDFSFNAENPVLVGWNWGKVDPDTPSFVSVDSGTLIGAMKELPEVIRDRLEMSLGGPVLKPEEWKEKFQQFFPRITAIWLKEKSSAEINAWVLPKPELMKLGKGKHGLDKKIMNKLNPLADQPFSSREEAEEKIKSAFGKKAKMAKRATKILKNQKMPGGELNEKAWNQFASGLNLDRKDFEELKKCDLDEAAMTEVLEKSLQKCIPNIFRQVDQQFRLIQSDSWVDEEIKNREAHLRIKTLLKEGKISEYQWNDPGMVPDGVPASAWTEFLKTHAKVRYRHMLNTSNLNKSITNDKNHIDFLRSHRELTRQELSRPEHIDFRAGGPSNREISKKYGKPYDSMFMRMLSWNKTPGKIGEWEVFVPGATIKGAFRKHTSQVLKTIIGETRETAMLIDRLFGAQGKRGLIFFSDAYLTDPDNVTEKWCSMDGIRINPATGQPLETAKRDYLFAYGNQLSFSFRMDLMDVSEKDRKALAVLFHMIQDFMQGDIPIGGEKTSGFGWVQPIIDKLTWLTGDSSGIHQTLFPDAKLRESGIWKKLIVEGNEAAQAVKPFDSIKGEKKSSRIPPTARAGFISHRSFGGHCGKLFVEANLLTPMNIQESGEPSFSKIIDGEQINGFDFYSISPPEKKNRKEKIYAIPGRSLRGMIRNIYSIASDTRTESTDISKLNQADSLFGWVGAGPNQAIMGRVVFDFAKFDDPELSWYKVPYPYGEWVFSGKEWEKKTGVQAQKHVIAKTWRMFLHAPIPPFATQSDAFSPDAVQATYFRAMLPGKKANFSIRFWNLTDEELKRLIWSVSLEKGLAHKMGNHKYLGFGSLSLSILPESFLIDWDSRYVVDSGEKGKCPFSPKEWLDSSVIRNYSQLKKALDASAI